MELSHGLHLAYCTNIHRGETWDETFAGLQKHTLEVKRRISPDRRFAIGLRLSHQAAEELAEPAVLAAFRCWLDLHDCYVFTVNGFPYGAFHGTRVKEQVYAPDWTSRKRVDYTKRLFDLLSVLTPEGMEASVSTVPVSFKGFPMDAAGFEQVCLNLREVAEYLEQLSASSGRDLHLGLEPEPMCFIETTGETLKFFGLLMDRFPGHPSLLRRIGVNYDTCHLALQYEDAKRSLSRLVGSGIRLSKLHLSSALKLKPTDHALQQLAAFQDSVYLHQTLISYGDDPMRRFVDLPEALAFAATNPTQRGDEWRVHFHIPLHASPPAESGLADTRDHLLDALDFLAEHPDSCHHLEMETYTWEVLPAELRSSDVADQLAKEYAWCLPELAKRGFRVPEFQGSRVENAEAPPIIANP